MESEKTYNAGPLTLDSLLEEKSYETARIFDGAEASDFSKKVDEYKAQGYVTVYEREIEGQRFASLTKDGSNLHVAFYPTESRVSVTEELNTLTTADIS